MTPGQQGTVEGKSGFIKGYLRMRAWEPSEIVTDVGRTQTLGQVSDLQPARAVGLRRDLLQ